MAAIKESNNTLISGHEYHNGSNIMSRCRLGKGFWWLGRDGRTQAPTRHSENYLEPVSKSKEG